MSKKTKKLPKFKNIKEEAEFWDSHDVTDYLAHDKPIKAVYKPKVERKETMSIRMSPSLKKEVDKIAKGYDISSSSLLRMWVVDGINNYRASR